MDIDKIESDGDCNTGSAPPMTPAEAFEAYCKHMEEEIAAKDKELERLKGEMKQRPIIMGMDYTKSYADELREELRELERKLALVKEHAVINFDNDLLKLIDAKDLPDNWHCPRCNAAEQTLEKVREWRKKWEHSAWFEIERQLGGLKELLAIIDKGEKDEG